MEMLQQASLLGEVPRMCREEWIFQQDKASNTRWKKDFFQEINITLL